MTIFDWINQMLVTKKHWNEFTEVSGAFKVTGSQHLTGSLGVSSSNLMITAIGSVSGSTTSTGSFGAIYAGGMTVPNLLDFSLSIFFETSKLLISPDLPIVTTLLCSNKSK